MTASAEIAHLAAVAVETLSGENSDSMTANGSQISRVVPHVRFEANHSGVTQEVFLKFLPPIMCELGDSSGHDLIHFLVVMQLVAHFGSHQAFDVLSPRCTFTRLMFVVLA